MTITDHNDWEYKTWDYNFQIQLLVVIIDYIYQLKIPIITKDYKY